MTDTKQPPERRVVLPVDPARRTEIDKQRVPMSARPYRLLALVKQDAVVRVQKEPDDTVMTWPHLLSIEFLAAGVMSIFLLLMGLFINAPLEELANGNVTPAVAKAPWYFLGLQEPRLLPPGRGGRPRPRLRVRGRGGDPVHRSWQRSGDPTIRAQDGRHAVHPVLHPRPRPDVHRDLLPRSLATRSSSRICPSSRTAPKGSTSRYDQRHPTDDMSNYAVEPADKPGALTKEAIKALRREQVQGLSRRQLLRGALGATVGLWILELSAGTIGFIWPNLRGGFGAPIEVGTYDEIKTLNSTLPIDEGFPAYFPEARSYVALIDTGQQFLPGFDDTGDGTALNVRALYQRCPHLGCKPNPCLRNFWLECPCHGSLRPARHQGRRRAVRPSAAGHGPLLDHGQQRRQTDHRYRQDHPGSIARGRRPARHHPATHSHGLHLTVPTTHCRGPR